MNAAAAAAAAGAAVARIQSDEILILLLKRTGCHVPDEAKSVAQLQSRDLVEAVAHLLSIIERGDRVKFTTPSQPSDATARQQMCTTMTASIKRACQGAEGCPDMRAHHLMYPTQTNTRRILLMLFHCLTSAQGTATWNSAESGTALPAGMRAALHVWLEEPWELALVNSKETSPEHVPGWAPQDVVPRLCRETELENRPGFASPEEASRHAATLLRSLEGSALPHVQASALGGGAQEETAGTGTAMSTSFARGPGTLQDMVTELQQQHQERGRDKVQPGFGMEPLDIGPQDEERLGVKSCAASHLSEDRCKVDTKAAELARLEQEKVSLGAALRQLEARMIVGKDKSEVLEQELWRRLKGLELMPGAAEEIGEMQRWCHQAGGNIMRLAQHWEGIRKPLVEGTRSKQMALADHRVYCRAMALDMPRLAAEIQYLRSEIIHREEELEMSSIQDNAHGSEVMVQPGRHVYHGRILEVTHKAAQQKQEMDKVVSDIRQAQREINTLSDMLGRTEALADEKIYTAVKENKEKHPEMVKVYRQLQTLRKTFQELTAAVAAAGRGESECKCLEFQTSQLLQVSEADKLEVLLNDLDTLRGNNSVLEGWCQAKAEEGPQVAQTDT